MQLLDVVAFTLKIYDFINLRFYSRFLNEFARADIIRPYSFLTKFTKNSQKINAVKNRAFFIKGAVKKASKILYRILTPTIDKEPKNNTTKNGLNVVFKPFLLVNHRGFEP